MNNISYGITSGDGKTTTVCIAFIGNSIQFANDFPRFFQDFGTTGMENGNEKNDADNTKWWSLKWLGGHNHKNIQIQQDSVLHGNLSLVSLLQKGNGMYYRWSQGYSNYSENAEIPNVGLQDYGCCTVRQLLLGYDSFLEEELDDDSNNGNEDYGDGQDAHNYYTNDGMNPCFNDERYLQYTLTSKVHTRTANQWDFIVLNDQSMRPALLNGKTLTTTNTLIDTYADMMVSTTPPNTSASPSTSTTNSHGPVPVFLVTYGYWRPDLDEEMTSMFGDVPTFTYRLIQGYTSYVDALTEVLPKSQEPRLAPIGIAFLVVWEENPPLWRRLFQSDCFHPSPHGTYLMGCVLHITLFDKQVSPPAKSSANFDPAELWWSRARGMEINAADEALPLPTYDEAIYLRWIANRVTRQGYIPESLQRLMDTEQQGEEEAD